MSPTRSAFRRAAVRCASTSTTAPATRCCSSDASPAPSSGASRTRDAANRIAGDVLRRLWRAPPATVRFGSLADEARRWWRELPAASSGPTAPRDRAVGARQSPNSRSERVMNEHF